MFCDNCGKQLEDNKKGISWKVLIAVTAVIILLAYLKPDENENRDLAAKSSASTMQTTVNTNNSKDNSTSFFTYNSELGGFSCRFEEIEFYPNLKQYKDNMVIVFECEEFEKRVREIIEKEEGEITYADVKRIEELYCDYGKITSTKELQYFSSLRRLHLKTAESDLEHLKTLKGLVELDVKVGQNLKNVNFIEELNDLQIFAIWGETLEDGGYPAIDLSALGKLEKIKEVRVTDIAISNNSFWCEMEGVKYIALENIDNLELEAIGQINGLELLSVGRGVNNSILDLSPLSNCVNLLDFSISGGNGEVIGWDAIGNCRNLQRLIIELDQATSDTLGFIRELTLLEQLHVYTPFFDTSALENCQKLKVIKIDRTEELDLAGMSGLLELKAVDLRGNFEPGILCEWNNLTNITISSNEKLTDVSIFKELPELERICLVSCPNINDISVLADFPSLERIEINSCEGISHEEIDTVKEIIKKRTQK